MQTSRISSRVCVTGGRDGIEPRKLRPRLRRRPSWSASTPTAIAGTRSDTRSSASSAKAWWPLKALVAIRSCDYHFVFDALPSFGLFYARAYKFEDIEDDGGKGLAEEEGGLGDSGRRA